MNEVLVAILGGWVFGVIFVGYLIGVFIFYGFCFSYWTDEYPASVGVGNVIMSIFFSLLFPLFLLPFVLTQAWKHGWRPR